MVNLKIEKETRETGNVINKIAILNEMVVEEVMKKINDVATLCQIFHWANAASYL